MLREKKDETKQKKPNSWAFLGAENVEDVNWWYEILEINQLCKGMSLVYSTLHVLPCSLWKADFFHALFPLLDIAFYMHNLSAASNVSTFTAHHFPTIQAHVASIVLTLELVWFFHCSGWKGLFICKVVLFYSQICGRVVSADWCRWKETSNCGWE